MGSGAGVGVGVGVGVCRGAVCVRLGVEAGMEPGVLVGTSVGAVVGLVQLININIRIDRIRTELTLLKSLTIIHLGPSESHIRLKHYIPVLLYHQRIGLRRGG
jgi:hypothetical protein